MPRYDFRTPRLFVDHPLAAGVKLVLDGAHVNYLRNVLRLRPGDPVLAFNGRDGEWRAALADGGKRALGLTVEALSPSRGRTPCPSRFWSAPKAASRRPSAPLSCGCPMWSGSASDRVSCGPIRPRWPRSRWSKACSGTGH